MKAYIFSQFRHRLRRALGVMLGIAIGTALFLTLTAFGNGYQEVARLPLQGVKSDVILSKPLENNEASTPAPSKGARLPFGLKTLTDADVDTIQHTQGVSDLEAVLQIWDFSGSSYKTVLGVSAEQIRVGPGHALATGMLKGRAFKSGERQVAVVDQHYAAFFRLNPGSTVEISGKPFQVLGVVGQSNVNQTSVANLYIPLADAQELAGVSADHVNQVYIQVSDAGKVDQITKRITDKLGHLNAISEDSLVQVMGGIGQVSARFAAVAAGIGLLGGLVLAWLSLGGLINERQKEIAIMKAVGWTKRSVIRVFLTESFLLSSAGGVIGIALGFLAAWMLQQLPVPDLSQALNQGMPNMKMGDLPSLAQTQTTLPVKISVLTIGLSLLITIVGGMAAGWNGVRKLLLIKPSNLLRK